MPQSKESHREYMRLQRVKGSQNTPKGSQDDEVHSKGSQEMFEGKPRYLTLSDGQVFDRTYRPGPSKHLPGMINCNKPDKLKRMSKPKRIALLSRALDKMTTGLSGKENLGSLVRYNGYTFEQIGNSIS